MIVSTLIDSIDIVRCITLPSSVDRQRHIAEWLQNVSFHYAPAFDDEDAVGVDAWRRMRRHLDDTGEQRGPWLEVEPSPDGHRFRSAKTFAHQESLRLASLDVLQEFLDSDHETMLVLEDDAESDGRFMDADIDIPDFDILVIGGACRSPSNEMRLRRLLDMSARRFSVQRACSDDLNWFSQAYIVNRTGARELMNAWSEPCAIDWAWGSAFRRCRAYAVRPFGVRQSGADSTIVVDRG